MPHLPRSVHHLNDEVIHALKKVKKPENMSVEEAKNLKAAILKNGVVDPQEAQLLNELIVYESPDLFSVEEPHIQGATPQTAQTISAYGQSGQAQLKQPSKAAADALSIQHGDISKRETERFFEFVDEKLQEVENSTNTHIYQYDTTQGTKKENSANCGPASAAIVGGNMGLSVPKLSEVRTLVNAPRGSKEGIYGLNTHQVIQAVELPAQKQGETVKGSAEALTTDVNAALKKIKAALADDQHVILLTSNLAISKKSSLAGEKGGGHYVVVKEVKANGSIVITDPQKKPEQGRNIVHSKKHFETHLKRRVRLKRTNMLLTFKKSDKPDQTAHEQFLILNQLRQIKDTWSLKGYYEPKKIIDPNRLQGQYQIDHESHAPKAKE